MFITLRGSVFSFRRILLPLDTPPVATQQNASATGFIKGIQLNREWLKEAATEAADRGWHFQ